MNLTLLKKELIGLRLCSILVLVFSSVDIGYVLSAEFPDFHKPDEDENLERIATAAIFGLLIGLSVFGQEREQNTISFLDGLPVSRLVIYLHKTLAAILSMLFAILVPQLVSLVFLWLSANSLSQPISWTEQFAITGLSLVACSTALGVTLLLSFAKQWFPLLAGLLFFGFIWMRSSGSEYGIWLDTTVLVSPTIDNGTILLPWKQVVGHGGLAILGWLGAGIAFMWRDNAMGLWFSRIAAWRIAPWLTGFSRLLAVATWISAMLLLTKDSRNEEQSPEALAAGHSKVDVFDFRQLESEPVGFAKYDTKHYEIIFRESQRENANWVYYEADQVHDEAAAFFQHPTAPGAKIVMDIASEVVRHASGVTNWTKIRVPLALNPRHQDFLRVLRHETAHVYIENLSNGRATDNFNAMRAFHEGVATAAEVSAGDDYCEAERLKVERWATCTDSRGRVPLESLINDEILVKQRENDVVYPLGYMFAMALIDVGGPSMPRRAMESLRKSKMRKTASSTELWRSLLRDCDTSMDIVIAAYEARLNAIAAREKDFVEQFPRLTGTVTKKDTYIIIQAERDNAIEVPGQLVCMVEVDRFVSKRPEYVPMHSEGGFRIPRNEHPGNKVRYLLGWVTKDSAFSFFEPWSEGTFK